MSKEFYIVIKGKRIPVTEEEYRAYKRPVWSEKKRKQRQAVNGTSPLSLDHLAEDGYEPTDSANIEQMVEDKMLLEALYIALDTLSADDRTLVDDIFYRNKSERQVADELDLSQFGVNKRKHKVLGKLYAMSIHICVDILVRQKPVPVISDFL